jgi:CRISPR/Cas system-associated exonuclease Cas4 (RecB family)
MARRIRRAASAGVPFDRIGVLLRNPERYQPILEEAFRRAGITAYFSRGSARPNPAGRALLSLLDCAAAGCSASKFAEYLSLGQVPPLDAQASFDWTPPEDETLADYRGEEAAPAPDTGSETLENEQSAVIAGSLRAPVGWEKLLVDAYVVQGPDRWERRLRGLRESLRQRIAQEDEGGHRRHLERDVEQLLNLERFALPLVRYLRAFTSDARWSDWLVRLETLARMSLRQPESVLAVLSEMQPLGEVGPVGLQEVREVLAERLRFLRREPPERRYGRVWVGGIEEARALSFQWVFLPGLAEGAFPRRALEDPLLLDEHRRALSPGLLVNEFRTAHERVLLRLAAAAAESRFVVSYPRMDVVQARPRVPSFYALEVVRAAEGRLPELARFGRMVASGSTTLLGWPAPDKPEHAIDDAEFDIATLRQCLALPADRSKGCGRYLVEVHDTLARSLRTRHRRWSGKWTSADGLVGAAGGSALAGIRLNARSYSPSSLQQFALCPYKFALHAIHKLRAAEHPAPLERMDPLTRGALFHEVQFHLLRLLESEKLLPLRPPQLAEILDRADRVFASVAAEYEDRLSPAIPRVWKSEVDELRADLHGWIRGMAQQQDNWVPYRFEFAFGLQSDSARDPRSMAEEATILDGFRLRGSIDLIERQAGTGRLRIVDHKTGKPPEQHPASIGGGTALQPVLYGLAVEHLLGAYVESGRLHYATQRGNYVEIDIPLNNATRERARFAMRSIDASIERGFLPAAPSPGACGFCDYRRVCGPHEELRVKSKPRDALEGLFELRSQP